MKGQERSTASFGVVLLLLVVGCGDGASGGSTSSGSGAGGGAVDQLPPDVGVGELACAPGHVHLDDGGCRAPGGAALGCDNGFVSDGQACVPLLPSEACAPGMMAVPGDRSCHVVAECPPGKWGAIPVGPDTQYVDAGAIGAAVGSEAAPWPTVQQAVDAAAPGAVVAIAAGVYEEAVTVDGKAVSLWGVCPSASVIDSPAQPTVRLLGSADGSELHMLGLTGVGIGLFVQDAVDVVAERVWIHDTSLVGVDVERSSAPTAVSVQDALVEGTVGRGVFSFGASLTLNRVVVRDTSVTSSGDLGLGVIVTEGNGQAGSASLHRVVVEHQRRAGLYVNGAQVTAEGMVVRDTRWASDDLFAYGVRVQSSDDAAASLTLRDAEVAEIEGYGVFLRDAVGDVERLVVRDVTGTPGSTELGAGIGVLRDDGGRTPSLRLIGASIGRIEGYGVILQGATGELAGVTVREIGGNSAPRAAIAVRTDIDDAAGEATMNGIQVQDAVSYGVVVQGSSATMRSLLVQRVAPHPFVGFGEGIALLTSETGAPSDGRVEATVVEQTYEAGIAIFGSSLEVATTLIQDVASRPTDGQAGSGILAQSRDGRMATLDVSRCEILRSSTAAIAVLDSVASVDRTVMRDVLPTELGEFGDGVVVAPFVADTTSSVQLDEVIIANVPRAGVANFSSSVSIEGAWLDCVTIPLNGEQLEGVPFFTFDNVGENRCGCAGETFPCKVLSTALEPPPAVGTSQPE